MSKNIAISLGNRCATSIWGVANNFRETKENGYLTCPFDLCVTNYKGIIDCINDDFVHFTDPNYLSLEYYGYQDIHVDNAFPEQLLIYNKKYNFCFNHESPYHADLFSIENQNWPNGPTHYIDNNFQLLIERYNKRIQNFRNYLIDPNNYITFMIKLDNPNENINECIELKNILNIKYPKLSYNIYIIE